MKLTRDYSNELTVHLAQGLENVYGIRNLLYPFSVRHHAGIEDFDYITSDYNAVYQQYLRQNNITEQHWMHKCILLLQRRKAKH